MKREFVQVSATWESIPGEITRFLRFSGNIGCNSMNIERNTFAGERRSRNKSPLVESSMVCAKS